MNVKTTKKISENVAKWIACFGLEEYNLHIIYRENRIHIRALLDGKVVYELNLPI